MRPGMWGMIAIGLWALTLAGGGWLFFGGYTRPAADGRTAIILAPAERDLVLAEMRTMLLTVQGIVAGLGAGDSEAVATAARASGMAAAARNPALMAKMPRHFMQMGMAVHEEFDALAAAANRGAPVNELTQTLATQLATCVACHGAYRLQSGETP